MREEWYSCPCCQGNGGWTHSQPPDHESEILSLRSSLLDLGLAYEEQHDAFISLIESIKSSSILDEDELIWLERDLRKAEKILEHPFARRDKFWGIK